MRGWIEKAKGEKFVIKLDDQAASRLSKTNRGLLKRCGKLLDFQNMKAVAEQIERVLAINLNIPSQKGK